MPIGDVDASIHSLTGQSAAVDELGRLLAEYLIYAAALVLAVLWFHRAGLRAGLAVGLGALVALGFGQVLGSIFPESRPFVTDRFTPLIAHSADGSFPSDHLLLLGALVGGLLQASRPLVTVATVMAVLVAAARVFVGVHHPIDVVAGFVVGVACGLGAWVALARLLRFIDPVDTWLQQRGLRPIWWGGWPRTDPERSPDT